MATFLERINAAVPPFLDAGFAVASIDERPEVFGNTCVVLRSSELAVRLIFDRGQFFADVSLADEKHGWFALGDVLSFASVQRSAGSPKECADAILASGRQIASILSEPDRLIEAGLVVRH